MPEFGFFGFPYISARVGQDMARGITPTSNVSYNNLAWITDGNDASFGNALTASMPQYVQIDLGQSMVVRRMRVLYVASNTSLTGSLQGSNDNLTYSNVLYWTTDSSTQRINVVNARFRYWRLNTTAGLAGAGINIYTWSLFG